jgi:hypothetical protein
VAETDESFFDTTRKFLATFVNEVEHIMIARAQWDAVDSINPSSYIHDSNTLYWNRHLVRHVTADEHVPPSIILSEWDGRSSNTVWDAARITRPNNIEYRMTT